MTFCAELRLRSLMLADRPHQSIWERAQHGALADPDPPHVPAPKPAPVTPAELAAKRLRTEAVRKRMIRLSQEGYSFAEIAEKVGKTREAVAGHLWRNKR